MCVNGVSVVVVSVCVLAGGWVFGEQTTANSYDTPRCVQLMSHGIFSSYYGPKLLTSPSQRHRRAFGPVCLFVCLPV